MEDTLDKKAQDQLKKWVNDKADPREEVMKVAVSITKAFASASTEKSNSYDVYLLFVTILNLMFSEIDDNEE